MAYQTRELPLTLPLDAWILIEADEYLTADGRQLAQLFAAMANYRKLRAERPSWNDVVARVRGWS